MHAFRRTALSLLLVLAAATAAQADRLDAAVPLGATTAATIDRAGDVATFGFLVTQGAKRNLVFTVKRAKKSALEPQVRIFTPDGVPFDPAANGGSVKAKPTSWSAKLPNVAQSGLWRVEVSGADGTSGGFTFSVKGKDTLKTGGNPTPILVNGKTDVVIEAGENVLLSVSAKRVSGSRLVPQLLILDANGTPLENGVAFVGSASKGTLSVKKYRLPVFGTYTLRFSGAMGTGGGFAYSVSTASVKKIKGTLPTATVAETAGEPGLPVTLDGAASAPGSGGALAYRWVQVSGPEVALEGGTTSRPSFTAPETPGAVAFQLSVAEAGVYSRPTTVAVEISDRPIADAGRSQAVASAAAVTLDGSRSFDRRGAGLSYSWRQIPGDTATVTLSDAAAEAPTFTAPPGNHTLHFGLTVDDGVARSAEDVVVVEVGTGNTSVADAGRDQIVPRMATVHLSGLASIRTGGVLAGGFQWTQTAGPAVTLAGATTPWPSFTGPRSAAELEFQLTIDGVAATADRVKVFVRPLETNLPAPARGNGPLNAPSGAVSMSASSTTDPENDALSFRWAQVGGAAIQLAADGTSAATATLPAGNAAYTFAVMANDGLQYGAPDVVSVRNSAYSGLPIAIAGADRSVGPAVTVTLDGRGSSRTDGGAGALTYQWTQLTGADWYDFTSPGSTFNPDVAFTQFSLPGDVSSLTRTRTVLFQLVVNDGTNASAPDMVAVTFTNLPLNGKPVVTVTPSTTNPVVGAQVTLNATAFDRDGDPMTFRWTQTSGPNVALQPNATTLSPSFTAPDSATPIVLRCVANDGIEDGNGTNVTITVDRKPVANIVVNPTQGAPGTFVTMDGSASSDPEGATLTYKWTQISGTPVTFNDSSAVTNFDAPTGAVTFRLVVSDGRQDSDPKQAGFSGNPPPTVSASVTGVNNLMNTLDATNWPSANYAPYGATVTLQATPGAGGPFTYTWRQINASGADPSVTLSSTTTQNPTFTVPMPNAAPFGIAPQATFGVKASDGSQESAEATVVVRFYASLNDGASGTSPTQDRVWALFTSCSSCHFGGNNTCPVGSSTNAGGYGMSTRSNFLTNSRGKNSCGSTKTRLPGNANGGAAPSTNNSANSYFWDRIRTGGTGPQMPTTGSPLTAAQQNFVQDWIDQGAHDN